MTKEERRSEIKKIYEGKPVGTGSKLKYMGETREFDIYKVPLELLIYNVDNGRISSLVKSYTRETGPIDAETEEGSKIISKFLYDSAKERNDKTLKDIAENGQLEPGIITMDGVIVDGNRRFSLLSSIHYDSTNKYTQSLKDACGYFLTRILPEDANEREILRLETTYQMGADSKVDYNAIEKYLHARDLKNKGFGTADIASYMAIKQTEVQKYLDVITLMDEYLEFFDYSGIYTRLPRGCEDDFLKLHDTLKKVKQGTSYSWIVPDEREEIEIQLKSICFKFIRLDKKASEGVDYRYISAYANGNNFLANRQVWNAFIEKCSESDEVEEKSTQDVLDSAAPGADKTRLLKKRDDDWRKKVTSTLTDAFTDAQNVIESKKEKDKPLSLLKKAIAALDNIETANVTEKTQVEFMTKLSELKEITNKIEQSLSSE